MAKKANEVNPAKTTSKAKAKGKVIKKKAIAKAETTAVTDKTLSKQDVNRIVREINELAFDTVELGKMKIGEKILDEVFQGSLDEATSRDPYKNNSLKQIIAHNDLQLDRRRLGEYVKAAFVSKELIANDVDCSALKYSHFAALLHVDDVEERQKLAAKANKGKWKATQLADEINTKKVAKTPEVNNKALIKLLDNPQALMKDKEAQKLLESPQDLEKLPFDIRMHIAKRADEDAKLVIDYLNLLKKAMKNIALIDLPQVIDVEAMDVQAVEV